MPSTSTTSPGTRKRSRRLSEVAKHLVLPSGITKSGYPAVAAQCKRMGVVHDDWQQGLGRAMLAKRANGLYAAGVGGVVLSTCRQVGKTFTFGTIIFALCILVPRLVVLWTAHHSKTSDETFDTLAALARRPLIAPYIAAVRLGNGQQAIRFKNGSRILFGAREHGFGRGIPGVSVVVFDEAQILKQSALNDMIPAANTIRNPLIIFMGTPPDPKDPSEVFTTYRNKALTIKQAREAGEDVASNMLYVEIGADRGADLDDRDQWSRGNPSFPDRTPEESILRLRELLADEDAFAREGLGIWDEVVVGRSLITPGEWACLHDPAFPSGRAVLGVKFSVDGALVGLAGAVRPDVGPVAVSGISVRSTAQGLAWLTDFIADRKDSVAQVVIDGKAGSAALINALEQAGVRARAKARPQGRFLRVPTAAEYVEAHAMFLNEIREQNVSHDGSVTLAKQVAHATARPVGKSGGWAWQGIGEADDVTLLDAATLAFWGARTTIRRTKG